jgi:hypothetical protein
MRAQRLAGHARLRAIEQMKGEMDDPFPMMVLRGGLEFTEWFGDWCERMEAQLLDAAPDERSS